MARRLAAKIEFDPGFRFGIGGGFAFSDFVAIGGETGVSFNTIDDIAGTNITSESDSTIGHVPMVANIIFKFPNPSRIVPFAGAGAGLAFVWFNSETIRDAASGLVLDGSDSDALFAWQVFGGVKYELNDHMAIGVSYKYFHADSPNWRAEDDSGNEFSFGTGHIETHSVNIVFTMKF